MPSKLNKAVFLDRDGVINEERGAYTWELEDFKLNTDLIPALKSFQDAGFLMVVMSNQGGIGKGRWGILYLGFIILVVIVSLLSGGEGR